MAKQRIVLAYSGEWEESVALAWLAEQYGAEIITVTLDLGQGGALADVRERGLAIGAVRAHLLDVRDEFAHQYILPALQAGALSEQRHALATALSRPLMARHLVRVAQMEGATSIAHDCTRTGDDQLQLEVSVRALNPALDLMAPALVWGLTRPETMAFARAREIPVPAPVERPYRIDANLWGRAIAGDALEDPWCEPSDDIYTLTRAPARCPDTPAYVEIAFDGGVPTTINGVSMGLTELIASLETIAGAHGVGRLDVVENRLVGVKSREVHEAPAAAVLHLAHRELETLVTPRDLGRLTHDLGRTYADLVTGGRWFSPSRAAVDACVAAIQSRVTGVIRVKLFKGLCTVVGRHSPWSLLDPRLASGAQDPTFDHGAAAGFIRVWSLAAEGSARPRAATPGTGAEGAADARALTAGGRP